MLSKYLTLGWFKVAFLYHTNKTGNFPCPFWLWPGKPQPRFSRVNMVMEISRRKCLLRYHIGPLRDLTRSQKWATMQHKQVTCPSQTPFFTPNMVKTHQVQVWLHGQSCTQPRPNNASSSVWSQMFKNQHAKFYFLHRLMFHKYILANIFQNDKHKFHLWAQVSDILNFCKGWLFRIYSP